MSSTDDTFLGALGAMCVVVLLLPLRFWVLTAAVGAGATITELWILDAGASFLPLTLAALCPTLVFVSGIVCWSLDKTNPLRRRT